MLIRYVHQIFCLFFVFCFCFECHAVQIAVVTMAIGKDYEKLVAPGLENKRLYCKKQGYDFICCTERLDPSRPIPWSKIKLLETVLDTKKYDWVFWTDADSVVTNFKIKLESLIDDNFDFILTRDFQNLNSGQFFLKNSDWSKNFLKTVYAHEEFINHMWWEQAAVIYEYDHNESVRRKTKVHPQRSFNSFSKEVMGSWFKGDIDAVYYQPGDFIIHFAGIGTDRLQELLITYSNKYQEIH